MQFLGNTLIFFLVVLVWAANEALGFLEYANEKLRAAQAAHRDGRRHSFLFP